MGAVVLVLLVATVIAWALVVTSSPAKTLRENLASRFEWLAALWLSRLPLALLWPHPGSLRPKRRRRRAVRAGVEGPAPLTDDEYDESERLLRSTGLGRYHPAKDN